MQTQEDIITTYGVNFPKSQIGKTVEYQLQELDSTGAPTIEVAWTSSDVNEIGNGGYEVKLTLLEGRYSLNWRIDGTPYVANEEVNVFPNAYEQFDAIQTDIGELSTSFYSGIPGGTRTGSIVGNTLNLSFQFLKNGLQFSPFSVDKVELYSNLADAQNNQNIIATITTILNSNGLLEYTTPIVNNLGYLIDKVYVTPIENGSQFAALNSFLITAAVPSVPGPHQTVRVYLDVFDITDLAQEGDKVKVNMSRKTAWYNSTLIKDETTEFFIDDNGQVIMDLIETDTMNQTGENTGDIFYKINIAGKYHEDFYVPSSPATINYKDLPKV